MPAFVTELQRRLADLEAQGLRRELRRVDSAQGPQLRIGDRRFLNFSSNDYLGLANHPSLKVAALRAVEQFGAGAGASRLICGSLSPFHELEETLAAFKGTEAALTFGTGYSAALGLITALLGKDDIVILDRLVHACIVDAARLSGAKLRVYAHNDLDDLEDKLKWADQSRTMNRGTRNILIATESIFSMDGDAAPLKEIVALKTKYGAWLMVDEAHATGLYGQHRRGLAEELDVSDNIEVQMGTLGKALGASGGYICGHRVLIDFLFNRARSFIFSTAPVPAAAAAATAALRLVQSKEAKTLQEQLWQRVTELRSALHSPPSPPHSAIVPIIIGEESAAVTAAAQLRENGIFIPAIRYPTVARGSARLRITLTATHTSEDVIQLARALSRITNATTRQT